MIYTSRVYDGRQGRGKVFLVDRIWPRGIKKDDLRLDGWPKEAAPSTELRRWFHQQPGSWPEFRERYHDELDRNPGAWQPLVEAARGGDITLLYGSRDSQHNNAVALKEYLEEKQT
jgi:uncharacterized protein YeaO (DUF488 family)